MECPNCGFDVQEGVTCPKCGAVRSEDFFNSSPDDRNDGKHRLYLIGRRRITGRRDFKSFMRQLLAIIIVTLALMLLWTLAFLT